MIFVCIAGIELDLRATWANRWESGITAALALGVPLLFGSVVATGLSIFPGWIGPEASREQFVLGVGMACAVTALPILILFMEKLDILRQPIGQRILRYASLDDVAIWGVLALILLDWTRIGRQVGYIVVYAVVSYGFRKLMASVAERDRWYIAFIWLAVCGFAADWAGFHFMVGAFLAGVVIDADWFDQKHMDMMRHHILLAVMPVFFLGAGLRTNWSVGATTVFVAAAALLVAAVAGKLIGVRIAGKILKWAPGEASIIGWLLQTKALIMIIFVNVLLDKSLITNETFTALLLMAVASTMLTIPMVYPKLDAAKRLIFPARLIVVAGSAPPGAGQPASKCSLRNCTKAACAAIGATRPGAMAPLEAQRTTELRKCGGVCDHKYSNMCPLVLWASRMVLPSMTTSKSGSLLLTLRFGERRLKAVCSTRSISDE